MKDALASNDRFRAMRRWSRWTEFYPSTALRGGGVAGGGSAIGSQARVLTSSDHVGALEPVLVHLQQLGAAVHDLGGYAVGAVRGLDDHLGAQLRVEAHAQSKHALRENVAEASLDVLQQLSVVQGVRLDASAQQVEALQSVDQWGHGGLGETFILSDGRCAHVRLCLGQDALGECTFYDSREPNFEGGVLRRHGVSQCKAWTPRRWLIGSIHGLMERTQTQQASYRGQLAGFLHLRCCHPISLRDGCERDIEPNAALRY